MYLYKKKYIGNKWKEKKLQEKIEVKGVKQERVSEITEEVAYWRKANAIHNWFVLNAQEGVDDCKEYYVSKKKLEELLETVNKVIKGSKLIKAKIQNGSTTDANGKWVPIMEDGETIEDPSIAKKLLPTTSGFFFGGTDYDKYYYDDLVSTKTMLEEILKEDSNDSYYYHSSW